MAVEREREHRAVEVVRGKEARAQLNGYACPECEPFFDALGELDGVDREALIQQCSRHRHKHKPYETPDGYWELSFLDEREQEEEERRG